MPQPTEGVSNLTITKLFFHATDHYACINCCPQSVSQSAMQLVSHRGRKHALVDYKMLDITKLPY